MKNLKILFFLSQVFLTQLILSKGYFRFYNDTDYELKVKYRFHGVDYGDGEYGGMESIKPHGKSPERNSHLNWVYPSADIKWMWVQERRELEVPEKTWDDDIDIRNNQRTNIHIRFKNNRFEKLIIRYKKSNWHREYYSGWQH